MTCSKSSISSAADLEANAQRNLVARVVGQVLQVAGPLMTVSGYVLAQMERLNLESLPCLRFNFLSSGILAFLAQSDRQWESLLLERFLGDGVAGKPASPDGCRQGVRAATFRIRLATGVWQDRLGTRTET